MLTVGEKGIIVYIYFGINWGIDMKRYIAFLLMLILAVSSCTIEVSALAQKKIMVYLKPDVTILLNDEAYIFKDANGQRVYPVIYNGTAYLPVRAISSLMKEPIEWENGSKTVFIGKTLSDPSKKTQISDERAAVPAKIDQEVYGYNSDSSMVSAYLMPNALVMYDFVLQTFRDVNNTVVYPINYKGSIFLPIRAVSELMGEPVEWDGNTKTILIGDGEVDEDKNNPSNEDDPDKNNTDQDNDNDTDNDPALSPAAKQLKDIFEREEVLYYEATAKITNIKTSASVEEKKMIAEAISENYLRAQALTSEIKGLDQSGFTEAEKASYERIAAFVESTEYYVLVLENIAYLAADDLDYSMLAETFFYFAMDSKTKMDAARP